jgi:hypothetical protein
MQFGIAAALSKMRAAKATASQKARAAAPAQPALLEDLQKLSTNSESPAGREHS